MIPAAMVCVAAACFAAGVHDAYARMDTVALRRLMAEAPTRADSLLARYRLFALTREKSLLGRIPTDIPGGQGRELALLSALWAYRVPGAAPWNVVTFGRRSVRLLDRALAAAPDDPVVRLVEAQSLLFRPGIAGGDVHLAVRRLRDLQPLAAADETGAVPVAEVEAWLWYGLRRTGSADAAEVRGRLLAAGPAPLYRAFLGADSVSTGPFGEAAGPAARSRL
jgi:hypothetical protein